MAGLDVYVELLKLSSEVDLDALTNTTRSLVAEFSEEVVPFALELSQSLVRLSLLFPLPPLPPPPKVVGIWHELTDSGGAGASHL